MCGVFPRNLQKIPKQMALWQSGKNINKINKLRLPLLKGEVAEVADKKLNLS